MTVQSRRIYEQGLDIINAYRGDPTFFVEGLRAFQATKSCPYAYAGVAFTFAMAAYGYGGEPGNRRGLKKAMEWLEKSQYLEPDRVEINFIEAVIYVNDGQLDNGRAVLDYLNQQDGKNYYLCLTEMNYWYKRNSEQNYLPWAQRAMDLADSDSRRALVTNGLAGFYLKQGRYDQSIKLYRQVAQLDPNDPWAWHNMSIMLVQMKQFKEAKRCNERALNLMEFGAARMIEEEINKNLGSL